MLWSLSPYWPPVAALLGAVLGSFCNVVIYRLPRGESIAWPASRCPDCSYPIPPHQNVPIVSYLFLRGRCASCQQPISPRYPLVEGITAVGCGLAALLFPLHQTLLSLYFLALVPLLVATIGMLLDRHGPDARLTLPMLLGACAAVATGDPQGLLPGPLTAAVFGVLAGAGLAVITRARPPLAAIGAGGTIGLLLAPWSLPLLALAAWHYRLRPAPRQPPSK